MPQRIITMVTPVEIINGTMNVSVDQIHDSTFSIIASIASLIVAISAIIGLYISNRSTKKSTDLYDMDLKSRLRPWVFPFDFKPTYVYFEKISMDYDKWVLEMDKYPQEPRSVKIAVKLKNTGLLPAKNFQFKGFLQLNKEMTKKEIEDYEYHSNIRTVFPHEEFDADIEIAYESFKIQNTGSLWLGFMAKYDIDKNVEQVVGLIGYFERGSARKRLTWDDEIKKREKPKSRGRR